MDLLQYRFRLSAAHDMASVRQRIRERHAPFDTYRGLRWKAFLVREAGVEGATDNQYAPVYAWRDPGEAVGFLAGPLFRGVTDAFGWTAVESWIALGHRDGPARAAVPLALTRATCQVEGHAALVAAREIAPPPDARIHSVWRGLDSRRWEQVEFTLWAAPAGAVADAAGPGAVAWELAHYSVPPGGG
jgi:hypothetical protein